MASVTPRIIHIRVDQRPQTLCGLDVADKGVPWTSQEGARELFDGEIIGLEACPQCKAKGQDERV